MIAKLLVLAALLGSAAGCIDVPETTPAAVPAPDVAAQPPLPPPVEGRTWLPPSDSEEREETAIELPLLPAGTAIVAHVALGSTYIVDTPPVLADVLVELRDAAGEVLAEGHVSARAREATLEGIMPGEGAPQLVLLSYGGSDGGSGGDRLDHKVSFR